MDVIPSLIPGCYELLPRIIHDNRGAFIKTFHFDSFREKGLETRFQEQYYSRSRKRVLRGLHFQNPPHDHVKLVYCAEGEVLDVVLDMRRNSPTYGRHIKVNLSSNKGNMLYIPKGLAHGFYVLSEHATMVYNVSSTYSPESDDGIHWTSGGIDWPDMDPILSDRDRGFKRFEEYESKFI